MPVNAEDGAWGFVNEARFPGSAHDWSQSRNGVARCFVLRWLGPSMRKPGGGAARANMPGEIGRLGRGVDSQRQPTRHGARQALSRSGRMAAPHERTGSTADRAGFDCQTLIRPSPHSEAGAFI
jgi:hypothetical protein